MKYIFDKLTDDMAPLRVAVVHPVDENSLRGAFEAAAAKLIVPVLVGPEDKIRAAAAAAGIDLTGTEIVATEHSHAAAEMAVRMVKEGKVEALMKGKLHTDEFLAPVVMKENGMRTDRRMSHVFIMQDPGYHKPLYITDAAMNIAPDLMTKRDIVQNAVDLFWKIEGRAPKVAILAATEEVDPKQPSTIDAAALTVMALRGQITGAKVEGPFAFDNAISKQSAQLKGIVSDIAGDADILVFPDIESGNIYFKSRVNLSQVPLGGIVAGARAPIILTSRSAGPQERKASAAIALLNARKPARPKP